MVRKIDKDTSKIEMKRFQIKICKPNKSSTFGYIVFVDKHRKQFFFLSLSFYRYHIRIFKTFAFTLIIMFAPEFYGFIFLIIYVNHNLWVNLIIFGSHVAYVIGTFQHLNIFLMKIRWLLHPKRNTYFMQ